MFRIYWGNRKRKRERGEEEQGGKSGRNEIDEGTVARQGGNERIKWEREKRNTVADGEKMRMMGKER